MISTWQLVLEDCPQNRIVRVTGTGYRMGWSRTYMSVVEHWCIGAEGAHETSDGKQSFRHH